MPVMHVGNLLAVEAFGGSLAYPPAAYRAAGVCVQRMLWSAADGDVLLLPIAPEDAYARYVTALLGVDLGSLTFLVPPVGAPGHGAVSPVCLEDSAFLAAVADMAKTGGISALSPYYFDDVAIGLTRAAGLEQGTPGFAYFAEGGSRLLNSKAAFRVLARGSEVPIPDGIVAYSPEGAASYAAGRLAAGSSVIVKEDFHIGGHGNHVLTLGPAEEHVGALRTVRLGRPQDAREYITRKWAAWSHDGRYPVVVETYLPDCLPIYLELEIRPEGAAMFGYGEMLMSPVNDGVLVTERVTGSPAFGTFTEQGMRLGDLAHRLGYRGLMSVDAIVTPSGEILANEINARHGGSTHIHRLASRILGPRYLSHHSLIAKERRTDMSFTALVHWLDESGLAFSRRHRRGVMITMGTTPGGSFEYCAVGGSVEDVTELATAVDSRFPDAS